MKKVLVIGADSIIGKALLGELDKSKFLLAGTTRAKDIILKDHIYLDLNDVDSFQVNIKVDVVILCAGVTKIAECEKNPSFSQLINYHAQIKLINYFVNLNPFVHIIFLSTAAVFSGSRAYCKITDEPDPISMYGKHKVEVEKYLKKNHKYYTILRLTKVLTLNYPLIKNWIDALENKQEIYPFSDLSLSPILLSEVIDCVYRIIELRYYGIVHLSGLKDLSYYDLALSVCLVKNLDSSLVKISSSNHSILSYQNASLSMEGCQNVINKKNDSVFELIRNIIR